MNSFGFEQTQLQTQLQTHTHVEFKGILFWEVAVTLPVLPHRPDSFSKRTIFYSATGFSQKQTDTDREIQR